MVPAVSNSFCHPFSRRIDLEWEHLRTHRASLARARTWMLLPDDQRLDDLERLIDATHRDAGVNAETVLARLVALARTDELAARVVVQRLLPGLVARSARFWFLCDGVDPIDVALPWLWISIHRFDVERRGGHVAASLLSDAIHLAFKKPSRRVSRVDIVEPAGFDDYPALVDEHAFEELAGIVRLARDRGVPSEHLDLLGHLVSAGSAGAVAVDRGVTARTVRNHRDRAIQRVRLAIAL